MATYTFLGSDGEDKLVIIADADERNEPDRLLEPVKANIWGNALFTDLTRKPPLGIEHFR